MGRRRSHVITFRLDDRAAAALKRAARDDGRFLSAYIRRIVKRTLVDPPPEEEGRRA